MPYSLCFHLHVCLLLHLVAGFNVMYAEELSRGKIETEYPQCPAPCGDNPGVLCPLSKAVPPRDKEILFHLDGGLESQDGW